MAAAPSPSISLAQFSALERRVAVLEQKLGDTRPEDDRWERMAARIRRTGDSARTIRRDIENGILETRKIGNRSYVRERNRAAVSGGAHAAFNEEGRDPVGLDPR
jgi:hypothetical protein